MGTKLVRRKGLIAVAALAALAGCSRPASTSKNAEGGPQIAATAITIRTTTQPSNRTLTHAIVIARDCARSEDELDRWRLFDLRRGTVTFVDSLAKTWRIESLQELAARRREAMRGELPDGIPLAQFSMTGVTRTIAGVETSQCVIRSGGYARELWIGRHPSIPPQLFAVMVASDVPASPLAPMLRSVEAALLGVPGFPFLDRSELPYRDRKLVIERAVVSVARRLVSPTWLEVPPGYRELPSLYPPGATPSRAPTTRYASRPRASSPLRDRTTPGEGSRSCGRGRRSP